MPPWRIERLRKHHDRSQFDCGHSSLNEWLRQRAGQFDRKDLARTFVATRPDELSVIGFYALTNHRVVHPQLPQTEAKGLPRLDIPAVLLGRLAVDNAAKGQGLGSYLLIDAMRRSTLIAEHTGVRVIEVDAIDDAARSFYLKFGFMSLLDDKNHLFLPIQDARELGLTSE